MSCDFLIIYEFYGYIIFILIVFFFFPQPLETLF